MWFLAWALSVPAFFLFYAGVLVYGMGPTRPWHDRVLVPVLFGLAAVSAALFLGISLVGVFRAFFPYELTAK